MSYACIINYFIYFNIQKWFQHKWTNFEYSIHFEIRNYISIDLKIFSFQFINSFLVTEFHKNVLQVYIDMRTQYYTLALMYINNKWSIFKFKHWKVKIMFTNINRKFSAISVIHITSLWNHYYKSPFSAILKMNRTCFQNLIIHFKIIMCIYWSKYLCIILYTYILKVRIAPNWHWPL